MKAGVELEFWVVDEKGRLDIAEPVAERVYFASKEFSRSMIEIQTEPHENLENLFKELVSKTEILSELAKKDGKRIVPLGTPLNSGEVELHESERFKIEEKVIGEEVRAAGRAAGLHIHFEKDQVLDQLNTMLALDPALALANSSPYYGGEPVADGSRNRIYRYRACGPFPEQRQLWSYKDSVEEWRYKRRKLFEKFREKADENGVETERLEKYFTPEDSVWTPVRLREDYPTVEWRAPDTTFPGEAIKLVQEISPIIRNNRLKDSLPDFQDVQEASEKAMDLGIKSDKVRKYLEKLDIDTSRFKPVSGELPSKKNIGREKAREIRLDYAQKLSEDLENAKKLF